MYNIFIEYKIEKLHEYFQNNKKKKNSSEIKANDEIMN